MRTSHEKERAREGIGSTTYSFAGNVPGHGEANSSIKIADYRVGERKRNAKFGYIFSVHAKQVAYSFVRPLKGPQCLQFLRNASKGTQWFTGFFDTVQKVPHGTILHAFLVVGFIENGATKFGLRNLTTLIAVHYRKGGLNGIAGESRRGQVTMEFLRVNRARAVLIHRVKEPVYLCCCRCCRIIRF